MQSGKTLKAGHQKNLAKKLPQELSHERRQKRYPQTLLPGNGQSLMHLYLEECFGYVWAC